MSAATLEPPRQNPADVYLRTLSTTRSFVHTRTRLERMARRLSGGRLGVSTYPWQELPADDGELDRVLARALPPGAAPATVKSARSILRGVIAAAAAIGATAAPGAQRLLAERTIGRPGLSMNRRARGGDRRVLSPGELHTVGAAIRLQLPRRAARDLALLVLLYQAGLTRMPAVRLRRCDVDVDQGAVTVKSRTAYVSPDGAAALAEWVRRRNTPASRPVRWDRDRSPFLTPAIRMQEEGVPMVPMTVTARLNTWAKWAGIPAFTVRDLRRTAAHRLLFGGVPDPVVRVATGERAQHPDVTGEQLRSAAALLALPDVGDPPAE